MFHPSMFIEHAKQLGLDLYTGVPCSFLKPFINYAMVLERVLWPPVDSCIWLSSNTWIRLEG